MIVTYILPKEGKLFMVLKKSAAC